MASGSPGRKWLNHKYYLRSTIMALVLDGQIYLVPGVYAITKIVQEGGDALPVFNVGVIVGEGVRGVPYSVGIGTPPAQTADQFILPFTNTTDLIKQAGLEGDSNAVIFMRYAKKTRAGRVFFLNVRPLTQLTGGIVQNAVTGAVTGAAVNSGNEGLAYRVNDILTITGGGGNCILQVATTGAGGAVETFVILQPGSGYSDGTGNATTVSPAGGSGCQIDISSVAAGQNALSIDSDDFGAFVNDISLTIASSIHTIIPPKNSTLLTADSGTGKTISVGDVSQYQPGGTVHLNANNYSAPQVLVIDTIDTSNNTITFLTSITLSATVANYARIFQEDTDNEEVSGTLDTVQKVVAFYATSKYLSVTISNGITTMPTTLSKTYIQNLSGATKATSPATQTGDWQNVADNFNRWNNEFAIVNKIYLRVIGLTTSDAENHGAFADMAIAQRAINKPVAICAGCELGDYNLALSDADHPIKRAFALNNENVQLAGFGLDGYSAALSYAGELFGIRLSNNVNHNQTWDILDAATVEKAFDQNDADYQPYITAGVVAILGTPTGFKVSQGVNTIQDQSTTFNPDTEKTYLIANRDVADFDLRTMIELLETANGADGITQEFLSGLIKQQSDLLVAAGIILSYVITRITKTGNAWTAKRQASISSPTDFIGLENTLLVN